jgi:hypothetical protein
LNKDVYESFVSFLAHIRVKYEKNPIYVCIEGQPPAVANIIKSFVISKNLQNIEFLCTKKGVSKGNAFYPYGIYPSQTLKENYISKLADFLNTNTVKVSHDFIGFCTKEMRIGNMAFDSGDDDDIEYFLLNLMREQLRSFVRLPNGKLTGKGQGFYKKDDMVFSLMYGVASWYAYMDGDLVEAPKQDTDEFRERFEDHFLML